jgi:hypothetical protein
MTYGLQVSKAVLRLHFPKDIPQYHLTPHRYFLAKEVVRRKTFLAMLSTGVGVNPDIYSVIYCAHQA